MGKQLCLISKDWRRNLWVGHFFYQMRVWLSFNILQTSALPSKTSMSERHLDVESARRRERKSTLGPNSKGSDSHFPVQVNFVACQLSALCAAFWFRLYLSPGETSPAVRHAFATIFGIYFVIFCFGWWVWTSYVLNVYHLSVLWRYSWHFPDTKEEKIWHLLLL